MIHGKDGMDCEGAVGRRYRHVSGIFECRGRVGCGRFAVTAPAGAVYGRVEVYFYLASGWLNVDDVSVTPTSTVNRSEEHTSELQSH